MANLEINYSYAQRWVTTPGGMHVAGSGSFAGPDIMVL